MLLALRQDYARFGQTRRERLRELLLNTGSWAIVSYRLRRWVFKLDAPKAVRTIPNGIAMLVKLWFEILTGIEIPCSASIGPGLYIPHGGFIVLNSSAVLGSNCTLGPGVVIGHAAGGGRGRAGCPVIGSRVYIGPGAILIGPISVGDDALIAPGSVVTRSVPPRGVVAGNPARLLSENGSFDLIRCPAMSSDCGPLLAAVEQ